MKATRYMRKPFIVTGFQVTDKNMDAIAKWCQGHVVEDTGRRFIRVPVDRPTNKKQTEAYIGTHVLLSFTPRGEKSFKVYTQEWLDENFIVITQNIEAIEIPDLDEDEDPEPPRPNSQADGVHFVPRPRPTIVNISSVR